MIRGEVQSRVTVCLIQASRWWYPVNERKKRAVASKVSAVGRWAREGPTGARNGMQHRRSCKMTASSLTLAVYTCSTTLLVGWVLPLCWTMRKSLTKQPNSRIQTTRAVCLRGTWKRQQLTDMILARETLFDLGLPDSAPSCTKSPTSII